MTLPAALALAIAVTVPSLAPGRQLPELALPTFSGTVVGVLDGDTVDVIVAPEIAVALGYRARKSPRAIRIRLYGIDAPEKGQPLGKEAKRVLSDLVFGKEVSVVVVTLDDFERFVSRVLVDDAEVNEVLVRGGYAWAFRRYLGKFAKDQRYCLAEHEARTAQVGVWRLPPKLRRAPWEYRSWQRGNAVRYVHYEAETAESCVASFEAR